MRPDLQELEITLGELKRLTGLKWSCLLSPKGTKKILIVRNLKFFNIFLAIFPFVTALFFVSAGISNLLMLFGGSGSLFGGILFVFFGVCCYILAYFALLGKVGSSAFIKEVNEFYQLILNINTLDELEAVGNPVKLNERENVLEALRINRENLVRALQTERILRENPQFRPEQFNIDLSGLRSLQATEKATEYGRFLNEALQIGVSVQTEMRKLENKRLGL